MLSNNQASDIRNMSDKSYQQQQIFPPAEQNTLSVQSSTAIQVAQDNSDLIQDIEEPKNACQLYALVKDDLKQLISNKNISLQTIQKNLRNTTNSLSDLLHNISTLLPGESDISADYKGKKIFDKINENIKDMKDISNKLQRLFVNVHGSMNSYRQKLLTIQSTIKDQHKSKTDLKQYIENYCQSYIQDDFKKINEHDLILTELYQKLIDIQDQREMLSLNEITKEALNMDLIKQFETSENPEIHKLRDQINKMKIDIQESQKELSNKEIELVQTEQEIKQSDENFADLENEIKFCQTQLDQYEKSLSSATKKDMQLNIEQISLKSIDELSKRKQDAFNKIQEFRLKGKDKLFQLTKSITEKMDRISAFNKSYHIIILLDDSGSMHQKLGGRGMFSILQQTPFEILSESIQQFVTSRKNIKGCNDKISIVKFSDKPLVIHKKEDINTISLNLSKNSQKGDTNFNAAFEEALNLAKLKSSHQSTILIFQTDGDCDETDECKEYVRNIKEEDPSFKMFTLGLGNCLKEDFLKNITSFANQGEEIMNKGSKYPLFFYQKLNGPQLLGQIFQDIALGISGQMEEIQQEMITKQTEQQEYEEKYQQKIDKLEKQLISCQQDIENNLQQVQAIKNNQEMTDYLEKEKEKLTQKKKVLQDEKNKQNQERSQQQLKLKKQQRDLKINQTQYQELNEEKKKQIKKLQTEIENEIKVNTQYKSKLAAFMTSIGSKDELQVKMWIKATNWFDYYLKIITAFTQKFKLFFERFKDISSNLQLQIDDDNTSSNSIIANETQIKLLELYFSGHEIILSKIENNSTIQHVGDNDNIFIKEQVFQKKDGIGITEVVEMILKEKYNIDKTNGDQRIEKALLKAKNKFYDEVLNIDDLLKIISYNRHDGKRKRKQREDDSDEEVVELTQMKEEMEGDQQKSIDEINSQINNLLKDLIYLKVIDEKSIKKIKKQEQIDKICNTIEQFDFDDKSESESSEESSSSSESDNDSDDNQTTDLDNNGGIIGEDGDDKEPDEIKVEKKDKKSNKSKSNKKSLKKKKKANKKSKNPEKKNKKIIQLTNQQAEGIIKNFKVLAQSKLQLLGNQKLELRVLEKTFKLIDTQLTDILAGFSTSKKAHQITNLQKYIQKEMIEPLDELLNFTKEKSRHES